MQAVKSFVQRTVYAVVVFVSPTAPPAATTSDALSSQLCELESSDVVVPAAGKDVQAIVARYGTTPGCASRLHSAFESIFNAEHRVEKWAVPLEGKIRDAAAAVHGAKVTGSCHTSLCRYDIELLPSAESPQSQWKIDRRIIDAVVGTPFQVESIHYGSAFNYTSYFYSTVVPAAFVVPLKTIMSTDKALTYPNPDGNERRQ